MYTLSEGLTNLWADPTAVIIMAFITYGFGFLQYGASMWMQVKNKQCPFYFWMHAWYIGHDFTFAIICWNQWFNEVGFWLFEVMAVACVAFIGIEIFSLWQCVKNERQEVFGPFKQGAEVSEREAWVRGILGYLVGILLFQGIRVLIGDPLCLVLMMSTNAILALMIHRRFEQIGHYQPGMKFLGVFTLLGTCFTFAPVGIGFFATMIEPLRSPYFFAIGALCIFCAARSIWLAWRLPKLES